MDSGNLIPLQLFLCSDKDSRQAGNYQKELPEVAFISFSSTQIEISTTQNDSKYISKQKLMIIRSLFEYCCIESTENDVLTQLLTNNLLVKI